jgi:hypothetical protein
MGIKRNKYVECYETAVIVLPLSPHLQSRVPLVVLTGLHYLLDNSVAARRMGDVGRVG